MGSSKYKNIKKHQLISAVYRLEEKIADLTIKQGTKHYLKLYYPFVNRSYPLAINHADISEITVEKCMNWLVNNKICSEQEFDNALELKNKNSGRKTTI